MRNIFVSAGKITARADIELYHISMGTKSFVYIGLKDGPNKGFYVKVGKSNNPQRRLSAYFTHCPGGLLSMHAARCESEAKAFALESRITAAIQSIPLSWHAGGEWTYVQGDDLYRVFEEFEAAAGPPARVSPLGQLAFQRKGSYRNQLA